MSSFGKPEMTSNRMILIKEAAEAAGISARRINRMIDDSALP